MSLANLTLEVKKTRKCILRLRTSEKKTNLALKTTSHQEEEEEDDEEDEDKGSIS